MSKPAPVLSRDVLVQILQHVSLQERLRSCALVSTAWAAAATTSRISISRNGVMDISRSPSRVAAFQKWLSTHGQHVEELCCEGSKPWRLTELPCPNLRDLQLFGMKVQLGPSSANSSGGSDGSSSSSGSDISSGGGGGGDGGDGGGVLSTAMKLTRLNLSDCTSLDGWAGLDALAALTGLRDLETSFGSFPPFTSPDAAAAATAVTAAAQAEAAEAPAAVVPCCGNVGFLSALLQLTRVDLHSVRRGMLEPLSRLTKLRFLSLTSLDGVEPAELSGLQHLQQLTQLAILHAPFDINSDLPGISTLTKLQELPVESCTGLDPAILKPLTGLQLLELLDVLPMCGSDQDPAVLLAWVEQLQQLTSLALNDFVDTGIQDPPAAAFSALTASSKLQSLDLELNMLEEEAWRHVFKPGLVLPHLTTLRCKLLSCRLHEADVCQLQSCCPALKSLMLQTWDEDLLDALLPAELSSWHSLRSVSFNQVVDNDISTVASMTQLERLEISWPCSVSGRVLLQLTALKQLTRLDAVVDLHTMNGGYDMTLRRQPDKPEVWQQLVVQVAECCDDEDAPAARSSMDKLCELFEEVHAELRASRAEVAALREQLAAAQGLRDGAAG